MKKILISQRSDFLPDRNEIRDGLDSKLSEILLDLGLIPMPISNCIGNLPKEDINDLINNINPDGIILSGGNDIGEYKSRDFLEKTLIQYSLKKKKPMLGICRGMQMVGSFFGATIAPINNHVNTTRKINGHINKNIKCFHNYRITKCPKEIKILAQAEDGCVEAIKIKDYPIIGIMWHPERENGIDLKDKKLIINLFK